MRRLALENPEQRLGRLQHALDRLKLHAANRDSYPSIFHVLSRQCYHLGAQSFVAESFADGGRY